MTYVSSSMDRMQELSKMLIRKFRKLTYRNVSLLNGYNEIETQYRALRDGVLQMEGILRNFSNYEHGNLMYKNFKRGWEYLNKKAAISNFKNRDIYEDAALAGETFKGITRNQGLQQIGQKYSDVFGTLSQLKKQLNESLLASKEKLRDLEKTTQRIDASRRQMRDARYDLEVFLQRGGYDEAVRSEREEEYESLAKKAIKEMKEFVEDNKLQSLLKEVTKLQRKHFEEAVDVLKFIS